VLEAMGDSPLATRAIWRYLLDLDWTAHFTAGLLPMDHPPTLPLVEPPPPRFTVRRGLRGRPLRLRRARARRSHAEGEAVVVEVADPFCAWNEGRWRVSSDTVERTAAAPDVRCDASALGSVYLGGFTWAQLARAVRAEELRPGGIARADRLFATDRAPWCPEVF